MERGGLVKVPGHQDMFPATSGFPARLKLLGGFMADPTSSHKYRPVSVFPARFWPSPVARFVFKSWLQQRMDRVKGIKRCLVASLKVSWCLVTGLWFLSAWV